jgi:hypothetical protein
MNVLVGVILMPFGAVLHSRNISSRDVRAVLLSQQADAEKGAMELRKKPVQVTPTQTMAVPTSLPPHALSLQ